MSQNYCTTKGLGYAFAILLFFFDASGVQQISRLLQKRPVDAIRYRDLGAAADVRVLLHLTRPEQRRPVHGDRVRQISRDTGDRRVDLCESMREPRAERRRDLLQPLPPARRREA